MGKRCNSLDEIGSRKTAGIGDWFFSFEEDGWYIYLRCPAPPADDPWYDFSQVGELVRLAVHKAGDETFPRKYPQPVWEWNGSEDSPTLTPSIRNMGVHPGEPDRWHGFLREGMLVDA